LSKNRVGGSEKRKIKEVILFEHKRVIRILTLTLNPNPGLVFVLKKKQTLCQFVIEQFPIVTLISCGR
jgi:hypothetical protein